MMIQEEQQQPVQMNNYSLKTAGFWVRFWAYCIDLIVVSAIGGLFIKPIFRVLDAPISNPSFILFSPFKITMLVILLTYFLLMTLFFQQTIGKMILGIKVVARDGSRMTASMLIFREVIGRFISKLLVLPYVTAAFMPKNEALHDIFADTLVIHENVYEKNEQQSNSVIPKGEQLQEQPLI